jgi:RecA-family ATPase
VPYSIRNLQDAFGTAPPRYTSSLELGELSGGKVIKLPDDLKRKLALIGDPDREDRSKQDFSLLCEMTKHIKKDCSLYATFAASPRGQDALTRKKGHFDDYMRRTITAVRAAKANELEEVIVIDRKSDIEDVEEDAPLSMLNGVDVKPFAPKFFVKPYLPDRSLSILFGDPGTSKSMLVLWMLARISRGQEIFGCEIEPADVMMLSNEDSPGISMGRYLASGGDEKRISFENFTGETFALANIGRLKSTIRQYRPRVVVIDSVMSHVGGKADVYRANEVSALLGPLQAIAEQFRIVVIGLMHMNKQDAAKAIYRVGGSIGFVGASRSTMFLDFKPEEPDARILCHVKANYSAHGPSQEISVVNGPNGIARLSWVGQSELHADDLLAKPDRETGGKKVAAAQQMLDDLLVEGPMYQSDIYAEAEKREISARSLERAKKKMGVISQKENNSEGKWVWRKRKEKQKPGNV